MTMVIPEGVSFVSPDEIRGLVQRVVAEARGDGPSGNGLKLAYLAPGAIVEYWSESFNRWVEARVKAYHEDGTLDLDVKRGANPAKVRARQPVSADDESPLPGPPPREIPLPNDA